MKAIGLIIEVAKKVFNWPTGYWYSSLEEPRLTFGGQIFDPLMNPSDTLRVIEKMRDRGHEIVIITPVGDRYQWEVSMGDGTETRHDSLGWAVCLSALKAFDINEGKL